MSANIDTEKAKNGIIVIMAGIALYIVYKAVKGVKTGIESATDAITPNAKSEKIDNNVSDLVNDPKNNPFDGQYMLARKGDKGMLYMTAAGKKAIADKLYNELSPDFWGQYVFPPHASRIKEIISGIKTKNQFSDMAYMFEQLHKVKLLPYLQAAMKKAGWTNLNYSQNMQEIIDFVNKLPK